MFSIEIYKLNRNRTERTSGKAGVGDGGRTALPCQGPLGKRVMGEEETDCHDQFANWSRNDMVYYGRKPPLMR